MKTLAEQLKEISRGAHYISPELREEIIRVVKERDTYCVGEHEVGYTDRRGLYHDRESAQQEVVNDTKIKIRQRMKETI